MIHDDTRYDTRVEGGDLLGFALLCVAGVVGAVRAAFARRYAHCDGARGLFVLLYTSMLLQSIPRCRVLVAMLCGWR